mgnify:CR=1 FL=1
MPEVLKMTTVYCPFCKIDFEAETWKPGECPQCNKSYYWDERCAEDYSDCWDEVYWTDLE